jgi:deoxyribose-phosphate aldolase
VDNDIARYIDHTLLKPEATDIEIRCLCREAAQFHFAMVCVNPTWVELCAQLLKGSGAGVCTVAGFPLGAVPGDVKAYEARRAVTDGADEVDMVLNIGRLKSGPDAVILDEIRQVAAIVHGASSRLKVIIEASLLTDEEKIRACSLAQEGGADYVKTATGFGPGGATVHDVTLMRQAVGEGMGVKAAGGIRDLATVRRMLAAGATRIGTSSGVKILQEIL